MSAVVIDSSAFVDTISDPYGLGQRVLDNLENFDAWWAPEVFDAEVAQSLRHQWMRGLLTKLEFTRQITALSELVIGRIPVTPLLGRVLSLSENVTTYDAAFIAVAELLDAPLITTDARMARAPGPRCEFIVVQGN